MCSSRRTFWTLALLSVPLACAGRGPTSRIDPGTPGELVCEIPGESLGPRVELGLEDGVGSPVARMSLGESDEGGNVVGVEAVEDLRATTDGPWPRGTYAGTLRRGPVALTISGVTSEAFTGELTLPGGDVSPVRCRFVEYTLAE